MRHSYDSRLTPPFPVLNIRLRALSGEANTTALPALIDTGADGTLVPIILLRTIQADEIYTARLQSHWGDQRFAKIYLVDLEIEGRIFPSIEVVGDEQGSTILIGRNVLNKLILLLDGPQQQSEIFENRPGRRA